MCMRIMFQRSEAATSQSLWRARRFSEQDVALIFSLLSIAGFQLRSDDPAAMKVGRISISSIQPLMSLHAAFEHCSMLCYTGVCGAAGRAIPGRWYLQRLA